MDGINEGNQNPPEAPAPNNGESGIKWKIILPVIAVIVIAGGLFGYFKYYKTDGVEPEILKKPGISEKTPTPSVSFSISISPNLKEAAEQGFQFLAGHAPFQADFSATVSGGAAPISFSWDFDRNGVEDSNLQDPAPYMFSRPGVYNVLLTATDSSGQTASVEQRIVAIGEPAATNWKYGVAAALTPSQYSGKDNRELPRRTAQMISAAGIQAVRFDFAWAQVQPGPGKYDWNEYDFATDLTQEFGLQVLGVLDYGTPWAAKFPQAEEKVMAPPVSTKFAWYAYEAANRYKDKVRAWQIWNEQNNTGSWQPAPDPVGYTDLLKHAYLAIKYADPEATVVLGGLGYHIGIPPAPFLDAIYRAGGKMYMDAVARHPYTSPDEGIPVLLNHIREIREVMVRNGDGNKQLWVTEYGWIATRKKQRSLDNQAAWLAESFETMLSLENIGPLLWYNFRDDRGEDNPKYDPIENSWGLVEFDWTPKSALEGYRQFILSHPN